MPVRAEGTARDGDRAAAGTAGWSCYPCRVGHRAEAPRRPAEPGRATRNRAATSGLTAPLAGSVRALDLQRAVGNRAVASLLGGIGAVRPTRVQPANDARAAVVVQHEPPDRVEVALPTKEEQQYELSISALEVSLVGLRGGRLHFRVQYRGDDVGTLVFASATRQALPSSRIQILDMTGTRGGDTKRFDKAVERLELTVRHAAELSPTWMPSTGLPEFLQRRGLTGVDFSAEIARPPFPRHEFAVWPAVPRRPWERRPPLDDPGPYGGRTGPADVTGPARGSGEREDAGPQTPLNRGRKRLADAIRQGVDLVTDFVPGVSNLKDLTIFLTGVNPVTGEKVPWWGRLLALVFAIPGVGNVLKYLGRGVKYSVKFALEPLLKSARRLRASVRRLGERLFGRPGTGITSFGRKVKTRAAAALGAIGRLLRRNAADRLVMRGRQVRGNFPYSAGANEVLFRRSPRTGKVTHYAVYGSDGLRVKRVDLDPASAVHGGVPPPHVMEYVRNTDPSGRVFANEPQGRHVRPARPDEIPAVN